MNITLKNVPDKVYRTVKRAAKEQGRSLNAQIIQLLETEAAQLDHLERATAQRLRDVAARGSEGIAANGAFLTERFGPAETLPEAVPAADRIAPCAACWLPVKLPYR